MTANVQIASPNLKVSEPMRAAILEQVEKLEKFAGHEHGLKSCHVEIDHLTQSTATAEYNIRLRLLIAQKELVATHHQNADFYLALGQAFNSLWRQVTDLRKIRTASHHAAAPLEIPAVSDE